MAWRKGGFRRVVAGLRLGSRRFACWCVALAIMAGAGSAQTTQPPKLTIATANIDGSEGQVAFRTIPSGQSSPSTEAQQNYSYETQDQKYVVVVDPGKFALLPEAEFGEYTFEASVKREADDAWFSYHVVASPTGNIPDQQKDVIFKVGDDGQATVSIKLPLHSAGYKDALQWVKDDPPVAEIGVSASQGPVITLQNSLDGLSIQVAAITIARKNCPQCWQDSPQQLPTGPIPAGGKIYPALNVRPKPLSALWSSASTLKPDATQDTLTVVVSYSVEKGGAVKQLSFDLPVRFTPSFWHLAIVVIAGAGLGLGLAAALAKLKAKQAQAGAAGAGAAGSSEPLGARAGRALLTMFLTAVAVTLLILLGSKLEVLGMQVDPRQMTAACIVAALIAGGSPVRAWASGIVEWGRGKVTGAGGGGNGD